MTTTKAALCVITSDSPLTKERYLDAGVMKSRTAALMVKGSALNTTAANAQHLATLLDNLSHKQAITWGQHCHSDAQINVMSKALYEKNGRPKNAVTRTNDHFKWGNGGGVLMLDCDDKRISKAQFIAKINSIIPLDDIEYVWRTSSSSYIYHNDHLINGLTGQRLYIFVKEASDIPRAGKVLFDRLWLAGEGYYEISKAGSYLERAPIDQSVFQSSRLDFASGSICIKPLEQRTPPTEPHAGKYLDSKAALPPLTEREQTELEYIKNKLKLRYADEVTKVRADFCHNKAIENLAKQGNDKPTDAEVSAAKDNVLRALEVSILTGDFVVTMANGELVTVGELLDNPSKYHGKETKDPLEPDYDNNKTCAKLYLYGQRPILSSRAHGGKTYRLVRQPRRIKHVSGLMYETTQKTLELMRALPDYFDMGSQLVSVRGGEIKSFTEDLLEYELGGIAQYWCERKEQERLIDPPQKTVKHILAMGRGRELKRLDAVITAPAITADNHIISKQGYDEKSYLYLDCTEHQITVPDKVSLDDAKQAYAELMRPFGTFNYADKISRSVALSAVLTALLRPTIPTAPAFAFDAPKQGSGKSYFCECLGILAVGKPQPVTPAIEKNEDEIRKTLHSMLMHGRRFIVWDNIMMNFDSATFASFLTAETNSGRKLGTSESLELPNRSLVLLTGNNIVLRGEMPRRVLTCRFDTHLENPTKAKRDLTAIGNVNPSQYIAKNRFKLAAAAITLIRGYLQSTEHKNGGATNDRLSSFEEWDTVARQPVVWLSKYLDELTDPRASIDDNMGADPEQEALAELLRIIHARYGKAAFTARELYNFAEDSRCKLDGELMELLTELYNGKKVNGGRSVGYILSDRRGRVVNGMRLERIEGSSKGHQYRIML